MNAEQIRYKTKLICRIAKPHFTLSFQMRRISLIDFLFLNLIFKLNFNERGNRKKNDKIKQVIQEITKRPRPTISAVMFIVYLKKTLFRIESSVIAISIIYVRKIAHNVIFPIIVIFQWNLNNFLSYSVVT